MCSQALCGYKLCKACDESAIYGGIKRGIDYADLQKCPFCKQDPPNDYVAALSKLVKRGNHHAMFNLGSDYLAGEIVPRDHKRGIEL